MTNDLIRILSDLKALIDYWNAGGLIGENELIDQLKKLNERLTEELEKKEGPMVNV